MSVLDVIIESTINFTADDLDDIESEAQERTLDEADNAVIYYSNALEILNQYGDPDPREVAEMVGDDD